MNDQINMMNNCDRCIGSDWMTSNNINDHGYGELIFCNIKNCKNVVSDAIYDKLMTSYLEYKIETQTDFDLLYEFPEDDKDSKLPQNRLKYLDLGEKNKIAVRIREKLMTYPESLHCYSGKFMVQYLNDLVTTNLLSDSIRISCEGSIRSSFNNSSGREPMSRPHFIAMCECGVESFQKCSDMENPHKRGNKTLVEGMKKRIKEDKQKYQEDSNQAYGF